MKINRLNSVILLGLVATIGILIAQLVWTYQAFTIEKKKFSQKVHIALLEVARDLYESNDHDINATDLIQKVSNDYYVVNINDDIDPYLLEHFLKEAFMHFNIVTDYEYAIYNCESDEMMYGKYVSVNDGADLDNKSPSFTKYKDLIYYFAIRFPQEQSYLFSSLKFWLILSFALIIILVIYVYSIYTLIQQKKFSGLQRDFINNMTHEFKTPLSSILLASNYMSNQDLIKEHPKLGQYANIIIEQGNKLNQHIERILNIARNDETALAIKPVKIYLEAYLNEIKSAMQIKYVDLTIDITIASSLYIHADEFHFSNMIHNILENAIKYCEASPAILIDTALQPKGLLLRFADNGVGVPPSKLPFIFDKFYRVTDRNIKVSNGFGLGLYYVKRIVQQHGWKITASGNMPNGLVVSVFIPKKMNNEKN